MRIRILLIVLTIIALLSTCVIATNSTGFIRVRFTLENVGVAQASAKMMAIRNKLEEIDDIIINEISYMNAGR